MRDLSRIPWAIKRLFGFLVALVVPSSLVGASTDMQFLQGLRNTSYFKIESKTIGRPYHIYVMVPDGYDESADVSYPTIYVLDGGGLFPLLTSYYRYLHFGAEVPDSIIVGISYGSDDFEGGNYRTTDYTAKAPEREFWGGAGKYQQFLSDELIPQIERSYRSQSNRRIIFGHSIGGQFVLYTALTQPNLFWGHLASNPALHRNLPFFLKSHATPADDGERPKLFVGSGSLDDPRFREPALKWIDHWTAEETKPWLLETQNLPGHSHMSPPPTAFRAGMSWLFAS